MTWIHGAKSFWIMKKTSWFDDNMDELCSFGILVWVFSFWAFEIFENPSSDLDVFGILDDFSMG